MSQAARIATLTLNPAIDQTVSIPGFRAGQVNRVQFTQSDPGGKGINVASILADCGYPAAVTGFLGRENTPIFERLFASKRIEDRFVRIPGATRTGIKIIDETSQETTDINFPGLAPAPADIELLLQTVQELLETCAWVVMSGSLPPGCPQDIYCRLARLVSSRGRKAALDTSGEGLRQALPAAPALVKPNLQELQEQAGGALSSQAEIIRAARGWLDMGIETVVVSMGAAGALFIEPGAVILARPPQVRVRSTVGAGDAMLSGAVVGKMQGASLAECARLGTAFAASAISHLGSGLPATGVVEDFKNQVVIKWLGEPGLP